MQAKETVTQQPSISTQPQGTVVEPATPMQAFWVGRGDDRLGEHLGLGISDICFKVSTKDSQGALLVVEMTHHEKVGSGRHFHYEQDEWFYVVEGEYVFEVGQERFRLRPGDSFFGPQKVPHVWAFVGDQPGRILFIFTPAGQMEAFFRETGKANAMPPQDPAFYRAYGMELVGPPLAIE
jgi:mannose-6-phosphate isomerase-like protein (cupin superfamily)